MRGRFFFDEKRKQDGEGGESVGFAVICSGQGAQSPEMFGRLAFTEKGNALRDKVLRSGCMEEEVAALLENLGQNQGEFFLNHFSQPLICLYQMMVWEELELPEPKLFAGYSLGELSAYGCAGAFGKEEVVGLAGKRARRMDAARGGRLVVVVGMEAEKALAKARALAGEAYLAIVLGAEHCVIGCEAGKEKELAEGMRGAGAEEAEVLAVSVASHTPFLDAAVAPFLSELQKVGWGKMRGPVLAGIDASKVLVRSEMERTLSEQIHRAVRWDLVAGRLEESGCKVVLELGPGRQLSHALLAEGRGIDARSVEEFHSWEGAGEWVERALRRMG